MKYLISAVIILLFYTDSTAQRGYIRRAIEKNYEKKYGDPGKEKGNAWLDNHLFNVDVQEEYHFPIEIDMKYISYKRGQKDEENYTKMYFKNGSSIIGLKMIDEKSGEENFMIYDFDKNTVIMLNEKEKTGMAINMNAFKSGATLAKEKQERNNPPKEENTDMQCDPTGKTKNIIGYHCKGYHCIDKEEDIRYESWITEKAGIDFKNIAQTKHPMAYYYNKGYEMRGMIMEGFYYKKDELQSSMHVEKINEKANYTIHTASYTFNNR